MHHTAMVRVALVMASVFPALSQHYCIPPYCSEESAVVGKYTTAASQPDKCYAWFFKFLNNVVPGSGNNGSGYRNTTSVQGEPISEAYDSSSKDILAMEFNECGLTMGAVINESRPMTPEERHLVDEGFRLETGGLHQCPCALQGRAHIINATQPRGASLQDAKVEPSSVPPMSAEQLQFLAAGGMDGVFGLHAVNCAFHSSGPCLFRQIEQGVARAWAGNFSAGYHPLLDNNLMLWTPTLGPLLDLFVKEGVDFFPMRSMAPTADGEVEVFSVLASPCGKALIEVASLDAGGRSLKQFTKMHMARAVLRQWNEPSTQPLVPLRWSRAIPSHLMNATLDFYGATGMADAKGLGFHTEILRDEEVGGTRAVTLKLSNAASVHLQLWSTPAAPHSAPWTAGPGGFEGDFQEAESINQVTGEALPAAAEFCESGTWTVDLYSWYMLHTHAATLEPIPENVSTLEPPVGRPMNVFLDDHISWDCVDSSCDLAGASRSLFKYGSHITYFEASSVVGEEEQTFWWPYSHDPAGHGFQLHWHYQMPGFEPVGVAPAICFQDNADGSCVAKEASRVWTV